MAVYSENTDRRTTGGIIMEKLQLKNNRLLTGAAVLLLVLFFILLQGVQTNAFENVDRAFRSALEAGEGSPLIPVFTFITHLGSRIGIGPLCILLAVWLWVIEKDYSAMAVLVLGTAGGNALKSAVKDLVGRERPGLNEAIGGIGYSFPSGHAMLSIIFYLLAAYFITKKLHNKNVRTAIWIMAAAIIMLIGLSRVVLGVHHATDVGAGYALGGAVVILCIWIYPALMKLQIKKR